MVPELIGGFLSMLPSKSVWMLEMEMEPRLVQRFVRTSERRSIDFGRDSV